MSNLLENFDPHATEELAAARFDERTAYEKGFAEIFERDFKPGLLDDIRERRRIDAIRKKRWQVAIRLSAVLGVSVLALFAYGLMAVLRTPSVAAGSGMGSANGPFGLIAIITLSWFAVIIWAYRPSFGHGSVSKKEVMMAVARQFGFSFEEVPHSKAKGTVEGLRKTALYWPFPTSPTKAPTCHGEFRGSVGHVRFDAWMLSRFLEQSSILHLDPSGPSGTGYAWLIAISLPVAFESRMTIAEKLFGVPVMPADLRPVVLESPDFNLRFNVHSSDQTDARVVLAPDVMDHLTRFRRLPGKIADLRITIEGDRAEILLPMTQGTFDYWSPHRPTQMIKQIHGWFAEIAAIVELIKDIDALAESEGRRGGLRRNLTRA